MRMLSFLGGSNLVHDENHTELRHHLTSLTTDVTSLSEHASFLSDNLTFLLDASLGLISIEQNAAMKLFSWAAVIFLPPTLVAGIFGMNFHYMPELNWHYGYPISLALMLATRGRAVPLFQEARLDLGEFGAGIAVSIISAVGRGATASERRIGKRQLTRDRGFFARPLALATARASAARAAEIVAVSFHQLADLVGASRNSFESRRRTVLPQRPFNLAASMPSRFAGARAGC